MVATDYTTESYFLLFHEVPARVKFKASTIASFQHLVNALVMRFDGRPKNDNVVSNPHYAFAPLKFLV